MLYTLSPAVLARHGHHPLVFSTPWVALGLGRYLKLALRDGQRVGLGYLELTGYWNRVRM